MREPEEVDEEETCRRLNPGVGEVTVTSLLVCLMYISVRVVATTVLGGGVLGFLNCGGTRFGSDEERGTPWV